MKVTLMDGFAPVQSIDYKTFNGEIKLTEKEEDEGEFPDRVNLNQYTFDEGALTIRLNDESVQRRSGLGGIHSIRETDMTIHITASLAENQIWYQEESKCGVTTKNIGLQDEDIDFKLQNLEAETSSSKGEESRVYHKLEQVNKYKYSGSYDIINKEAGSATWKLKPMMTIDSEAPDCKSARCYMPIRVIFIWGDAEEEEEESNDDVGSVLRPQEDLVFTPYGTGKTIGDVIQMEVNNPTPDAIAYYIGPSVTPATGKYQGYTIIDEFTGTVNSGQTISFPVNGICYDAHSKPVPAGMKMAPISEWTTDTEAGPAIAPGFVPPADSDFKLVDDLPELSFTYPGTEEPFEYTIQIGKHTEQAASLLLETMRRIEMAYDSLEQAGMINTPFNYDPAKERESSLQQIYWIATSRLDDDPYTEEQFQAKLIEQFEENTHSNYDEAPQVMKDQLEEGADVFWSTFVLVGEEAKVLQDTEADPKKE